MLEVRLLGGFEIKAGKKSLSLPSRAAQSLFAFLILNIGTPYRREKLAGMLWADSTEEAARDYLRHALWRIRKLLQEGGSMNLVQADDLTIGFDPSGDVWFDCQVVKNGGAAASPDEMMKALSAYGGELLPGFYDEWVVLEREHMQATYEQGVGRLLNLLQEAGRWSDVQAWAEKWIAFGQRPEAAYRALMSAYAANGDMSRVAATYERCVKTLKDFGVEPSEQTRQLFDDLKAGKHKPQVSSASAPAAVRPAPTSTIPVPLTSFIGRDRELKKIAELLASTRLLTLTGPGGVGKTRLAIEAARSALKDFKDGVFWVNLAALTDENLIPQEIAQALHLREAADEPLLTTVAHHMQAKEALLVLDNCEHLVASCAGIAEQLLGACPGLRILATSIEGLGLFSESVWQVPSLPLPGAGSIAEGRSGMSLKDLQEIESIRLFVDRAANANPAFVLNGNNATDVTQICRRLDGIPLAIELAAARIKVLSVQEIAARLDDRFSLLTAGSRTAIPRHQTLRATIDWSHDLLSEPERILLRRLSVFTGGFTLDAAESVCGQDEASGSLLDSLGRLVDKSLVVVEAATRSSDTRYRLLETIRQYAIEKLLSAGEAQAIRERHLNFYVRMAEDSEASVFANESGGWSPRLNQELDNLRAAIEWSTTSGKADFALRILGSLVYFWFARGLLISEWHDGVQAAFHRPEGTVPSLARAKALNGVGFWYWADLYSMDRRPDLEEALSIGRELSDPWNIATALRSLGQFENIQGNYSAARAFLEESLEIWRGMGRRGSLGCAMTLMFLGDLALNQDEIQRAQGLYEESIAVLGDPSDVNFQAYSVRRLGQLAWRSGKFARAFALCKESLELNQAVGDPRGICACLAAFAAIAAARREYPVAATLAAAVESQLAAFGIRLLYVDRMEYGRTLESVREHLDAKKLAQLWSKGKTMPLDGAVEFALEGGV